LFQQQLKNHFFGFTNGQHRRHLTEDTTRFKPFFLYFFDPLNGLTTLLTEEDSDASGVSSVD
jgi:hypothetical protein